MKLSARFAPMRFAQTGLAILALISLLGFAGRFGWLFDLCSHFRLEYACIFAAATLSYLVLRNLRWAAACSAVFLLNAGTIFGAYISPAESASTASRTVPLRVMQMNVCIFNTEYGRLVKAVRAADADVVGIEEYSDACDKAFERAGLWQQYPYRIVVPTADRNWQNALLSKLPLANIRYSVSSSMHDRTLIADCLEGTHTTSLILMHPRPPVHPALYDRACEQMRTIVERRHQLRNNIVLIGDLNSTQFSWRFADLADGLDLRDSRLGHGPAPSWPVWCPLLPIDFVLVSKDIRVTNFRVGGADGSDHAPLVVDLAIGEP